MPGKSETVFCGNGVSPGIVLGQALKLDSQQRVVLRSRVPAHLIDEEVERLENAIAASREQLEGLKARLEKEVGFEPSYILEAHLLMLDDRSLIAEMAGIIRQEQANAEWAVRRVEDRIRRAYLSLDDQYFRERVSDIESVLERLILNLSGAKPLRWETLPNEVIIVSRGFNPAFFATIDLERVRGLALEAGGRTSHTAILSRSLGLPAVMEIPDFIAEVMTGDALLLDGDEGRVVLHPSTERLDAVRTRLEEFQVMAQPPVPAGTATATRDGVKVVLKANTELPLEVLVAQRSAAEGIGLFRSELLFLKNAGQPPTMLDQLETYSMLAREMSPHPVAVRTLDLGAEDGWSGVDLSGQNNPSMGLRGIRLSLVKEKLFAAQVEAILRASCAGKVELVLPMVTSVEEVREAKAIIERIRGELLDSCGPSVAAVPLGVMVEVPAAVISLEALAREVDFLCVGTNDLIQYLLAVDRGNPRVAHLFQPLHPAMLQSLGRIASVAAAQNKPVRICGEMSANPVFAVLLLGMGFTELSMNCISIAHIRKILREITMVSAAKIAKRAMEFQTAAEAAEYLLTEVSRLVTTDLSPYVREVLGMDLSEAAVKRVASASVR
jgi:phosphotransferase system enzyme I (PtsI)